MSNPRMPVPRLSEDEMREIVLDRLACKVMFSGEIHASTRSLCFFPIALGALAPPPELVEELLGSSEPPEALEGEPPKPTHPGYPEAVGDPPERPALGRVPTEVESKLKWGDIDEVEYQACADALKVENEARIRAWHDDSMAWHDALIEERRVRREIDEAHNAAVEAWEASLSQHAKAVEAREAAAKDWKTRYGEVFAEWGHDIGEIMGRMKDAFPRGVNGYPMFHSCTVIHKDDWKRIENAIVREQAREVTV